MRKGKKIGKTELLHVQLRPDIKKALREDAEARGLSMGGIVSNVLYQMYIHSKKAE